MTRRRRPDEYLFVSQSIHRDPKVAGLATDSARWAWIVALAEAKRLRSGGRFANEGQFAMCVGTYAAHLDELLDAALLARDGREIIVVNYDEWQDDGPVYVDRTKAERDARYRESHRAELAARMAARRSESSADATDDVTPPAEPVREEEQSLAARYKRIVQTAARADNPVTGAVDGYRAIFGPEPKGAGGRLAALVRDHPYGARGVVTDLAIAASRDVGDPLDYVAGVIRATKKRQAPARGGGKGETQDAGQYDSVGSRAE